MSELLYEVEDAVAWITLNRPDRYNAITGKMLDELSARLVEADRSREVRVVVVTGAGKGFCAGLDLKDQAAGSGIAGEEGLRVNELDLRDAPPIVLHMMDTPTICMLNGAAAGYGMDLALGCDIRVAASSAKLAAAFTKRGVLPESGGTWLLPRLVGAAKAAELCFTGRTLDAAACLELGLVNEVVPDESLRERVAALAAEIAANAPLAVRATKRMLRAGQQETFPNHVQHVFVELLPLFRSQDFKEGVAAFMEKRPANFQGR